MLLGPLVKLLFRSIELAALLVSAAPYVDPAAVEAKIWVSWCRQVFINLRLSIFEMNPLESPER